jgi:hypothetical protein
MQVCADDDSFGWIDAGRIPFKKRDQPDWQGNFVANLLPRSFEAYVKILHRIDANYYHVDHPLSPSEIAILKIPRCEALRDFILNLRESNLGTRVRWKDLCALLSVPFAPEINIAWYVRKLEEQHCWPRLLYGPGDAALDVEGLAELVSVLSSLTPNERSFFRFARWQFPREETPRLFTGELEELQEFLQSGKYQVGPEYWWPSNRAWCVCSEYDLQYTIVGGTRKLISMLLGNPILECIQIEPQTRIDYQTTAPVAQ